MEITVVIAFIGIIVFFAFRKSKDARQGKDYCK